MRVLPDDFKRHLSGDATSLCHCWRVKRLDGLRLGFTDHDRSLEFDGTVFRADSGFTPGAMESALGLSVDNMEAEGALSDGAITEEDLNAGLWDDAAVEIFRVNWDDPEQRVLLHLGTLGEVTRRGRAFRAELRGLSHRLDEAGGRQFTYACDAELGDSRCGVELNDPRYRFEVVAAPGCSRRRVLVAGASGAERSWFARGHLRQGPVVRAIRSDAIDGALRRIDLWEPLPRTPVVGADLILTAGCDKQFATCQEKFSNTVNYRGFPHMPGNDFVQSYPRGGDRHDGGRRGR